MIEDIITEQRWPSPRHVSVDLTCPLVPYPSSRRDRNVHFDSTGILHSPIECIRKGFFE